MILQNVTLYCEQQAETYLCNNIVYYPSWSVIIQLTLLGFGVWICTHIYFKQNYKKVKP